MVRIIAVFCSIMLCVSSVAFAETNTNPKQTLVTSNEKEGVYVFATPDSEENMYKDFHVKIGNEVVETRGWEVEMREERQPELHVVDLNHDGQKEIVVILTIGTGTWVVEKEAHILQKVETKEGKGYEEMDIDNPVHTIERDFMITATDKTIEVKGRGQTWRASNLCGKTYYHHRFPLYQSVNWKMKGNHLIADVGLTLTYDCVPAGFVLTYQQKGEIYVAKHVKVNL